MEYDKDENEKIISYLFEMLMVFHGLPYLNVSNKWVQIYAERIFMAFYYIIMIIIVIMK